VILAKDEDKQKQIREKASRDAASTAARTIGMTHSASAPITRPTPASPAAPAKAKPLASAANAKPVATAAAPSGAKKDGQPARIPMLIQKIPPFNPSKAKGGTAAAAQDKDKEKKDEKEKSVSPAPADAAPKLNPSATSFKLKPNAPTFKPVVSIFRYVCYEPSADACADHLFVA